LQGWPVPPLFGRVVRVTVCPWPTCTNEVAPSYGPRVRIWCSRRCCKRASDGRRKPKKAAKRKANETNTRGRFCADCLIRDTEMPRWGGGDSICGACQQTVRRLGRCKCGKVMRCILGNANPAYCGACDAAALRARHYAPVFLLAPGDDRERVIWRPVQYKRKVGVCGGPQCSKRTLWVMEYGRRRRRLYCSHKCCWQAGQHMAKCAARGLPEAITATPQQWRKWR